MNLKTGALGTSCGFAFPRFNQNHCVTELSRGLSLGIPEAVLGVVSHIKRRHQAIHLRSLLSLQDFHGEAISLQLGSPVAFTFLILLPVFQMPLEIHADGFFFFFSFHFEY